MGFLMNIKDLKAIIFLVKTYSIRVFDSVLGNRKTSFSLSQSRSTGVNNSRSIWYSTGFPGSSAAKESACSAGDPCSIPGSGRSLGEGIGYPLQYSCLENPHRQKSLAGCSPWGRKESDMTEWLSIAWHRHSTDFNNDPGPTGCYFLSQVHLIIQYGGKYNSGRHRHIPCL